MEKTIATRLRINPGDEVLFVSATAEQRALARSATRERDDTEAVEDGTSGVAVLLPSPAPRWTRGLAEALPHRDKARATWIAYPKANHTDINRDSIWRRVEELGWTLNGNVSISHTWSAVRIKPKN